MFKLFNTYIKNNLGLIDTEQKKYLTTRLVETMKMVFTKIDTHKLTPGNFQKVMAGVNEVVLQKMNDMIAKSNVGMMSVNRGIEVNPGQTKQSMLSSRPQFTSMRDDNRFNQNPSFMPVDQFNQPTIQFNPIGSNSNNGDRKKDFEESARDRFSRMQAERDTDRSSNTQRPSTPDFSLDGSGSKKKQEQNNNLSIYKSYYDINHLLYLT